MRVRMPRPSVLEALASLLAIAIVWTFVSPQSFRPRRDPRATAESDLAAIQWALATYRAETGDYPTTAQGLAALLAMPASRPWNWRGPYVLQPILGDPWGNPYVYRRDDATATRATSWRHTARTGSRVGKVTTPT